jgi:lysophospholipase L1-like esterase
MLLLPFAAQLLLPIVGRPADVFELRPEAGTRHVSLPVAEGNYRISVELTGDRSLVTAVSAEQRRFMAENVRLDGDEAVTRRFVVNVRGPQLDPLPANAPGGTRVRLSPREEGSGTWDGLLNLAIAGPGSLASVRVERVEVPTLYLAGDSTVTDQAESPYASWGQFITLHFRDDMAVANHAQSGESLNSFMTGLRFAKLLSTLRPGDWVMIQFGHNDQKSHWPQTYAEASTTYRSWLRLYVDEIRRRGATPLLVTPPERLHFDASGRIRPTLADYGHAMREVAREQAVALIDLQAASIRLYEAMGPDEAPKAFAENGTDLTHHSEFGARELARAVIGGLREADPALTAGLETHIAGDARKFDTTQREPR